jgi:hypothetical protein
MQVPGNRIAHFSTGGPFTAPQLKIIQEILAITAFAVFSIVILKERLRWSDYLAFALIICGEYSPATSADIPAGRALAFREHRGSFASGGVLLVREPVG